MANERLFELLAQALSQPSGAYKAATAALDIPNQALQGYLGGSDIADKLRQRKLAQQTLFQMLGPNLPQGTEGYGNLTQEQFEPVAKLLTGLGSIKRANQPEVNFLLPEQAKATGVSEDVIKSYGGKPIPRQVGQMDISRRLGETRNENLAGLVGARQAGVQNAVLNTAMRYSQAGMVQSAAKDSFGRLANINRAQQILSQIQSQGGGATIRQRTELAAAVGRSINPTGVLTNEALSLYIPQTLRGRFGNFTEYLSNESAPVDFTGFTGELGGLLQREKEVNQGLIQTASQFGKPAIEQLQNINPSLAASVRGANQNPLVSNPSGFPAQRSFSSAQEAEASGYKGPAIIAGRKAIIH